MPSAQLPQELALLVGAQLLVNSLNQKFMAEGHPFNVIGDISVFDVPVPHKIFFEFRKHKFSPIYEFQAISLYF